MGRIFLSYAREDVAAAETFSGELERAGHEVWWDHHLRVGSRFSWDIAASLKSAEAVVVLWSKDSVDSAWVQDEAAEGLEGSRLVPVGLDGSKPPLGFRQYHTVDMSGWRNDAAVFARLVEAIAATIAGTVSRAPPRADAAPSQPSICVLPFANKSGDSAQDYFSDGITEDVITDLFKVSSLSVVGRNAGITDPKQLAAELGVSHVVEGTVRKSASRLRITAQLIDAVSGRSLWAERYDRELSDVFEIQDEISHAIVEALQLTLLPHEKSAIAKGRTTSAEAYDLYLKARPLWEGGSTGDYRKNEEIVRLCRAATDIDPAYAQAWVLAALAASELRFWQGMSLDAIGMAEKALALDGGLPEPHCVRARHLEEVGSDDEARTAVELALQLDPTSWEANREAGQLAFRLNHVPEAVTNFENAVRIMWADHASASTLISAHRCLGDLSGMRRAAEATVAAAEHFLICEPSNGSAFASAARGFAALGESDRARKWIRKALNVDPGNLAMRYSLAATAAASLGDESYALEILEPFAEAVRFAPHLRMLERDPDWAEVRDGPQFQMMLQRARRRLNALVVSC